MIVYLTGTENKKIIENAIYEIQMENTLSIGEPIISNRINLLQEAKSNLCKNKDIDTIIIDLSVVENDDIEIKKAIMQLRFFNNDCRFIIVATERSVGDELLSAFVDLSIYNIITNEDDMIVKIKAYAINNATFKEASVYKNVDTNEDKSSKANKNKVTKIKNDSKKINQKIILQPMKGKIIVSVVGTQARIGTTHNSILLAYNLMKKGYSVAIAEFNKSEDFKSLPDCYEHKYFSNEVGSLFKIDHMDFYPNCDKENLGRIEGLDYDYIVVDNGEIESCDINEHNRADVKICIFGAKAWEQKHLSKLFNVGANIIKNYRLLTMCDESTKKDILGELPNLKIQFLNYSPEPFSVDSDILNIMENFLYEQKNNKSIIKRIFNK